MRKSFLALLLLAAVPVAWAADTAAAKKVPITSLADDEVLKSAKELGFMIEGGKPETYPKKIAIGQFQVNWTPGVDADMQAVTDAMYAELVARLKAEGFEVIDQAAVLAAPTYAGIEAGTEPVKAGTKRTVLSPTGMKNPELATRMTVAGRLQTNPLKAFGRDGISTFNAEVGADATLLVYTEMRSCKIGAVKKEADGRGWLPGDHACIHGNMTGGALIMDFVGGTDKKSAWESMLLKEVEVFEYNKMSAADREKLVYDTNNPDSDGVASYDAAIIAHDANFGEGAKEAWRAALHYGFAVWAEKNEKGMADAGVTRKPPSAQDHVVPSLAGT